MKMRKLMAVVLAVVVAISAMAISAFATDYESYDIPLANAGTTTTASTTYELIIPFYGTNGYLYYGDTITLVLPVSVTVSSAASSTYAGTELTPSYTLTTAEGITVNLQDPDVGTITYCDKDGNVVGTSSYTWVQDTEDTDGDGDTEEYVAVRVLEGEEGDYYVQTVDVGYSYRDYIYPYAGSSFEMNAMIHQTTTWSSSCNLTVNMTVDTSSVGCVEDPADAKITWQFYGSWTDNGQSALLTYTPVSDTDGSTVTVVYGYQVYAGNGNMNVVPSSSTTDNTIVILANVDGTTGTEADTVSALLYWDHTLTQRGMIQNALATEGAYAEVVVELNGTITGYAVYTLSTVSNNDATADWAGYTYWWNKSAYSALTVDDVSSYTLSGTTGTLTFEVPLSQLYNATYGLYNGGFTISQLITADYSDYNYYTETVSSLNKLTATEVNLVLYIPVDDTAVDTDEPVEDTDTATEEDGEDTDLDVGDVDETPAETNPTTGIVLALVPMAVAAAAAVASKRR